MLSRLHIADETKKRFPFHPEDEKDSVSRFTRMLISCLGAPLAEKLQRHHYPQEGGLLFLWSIPPKTLHAAHPLRWKTWCRGDSRPWMTNSSHLLADAQALNVISIILSIGSFTEAKRPSWSKQPDYIPWERVLVNSGLAMHSSLLCRGYQEVSRLLWGVVTM